MGFDWIQQISGTLLSVVSLTMAALTVARLLIYELRSLSSLRRSTRPPSRSHRRSRKVRLLKDGHEIDIRVDPSNEESVRSLLRALGKDAADPSPEAKDRG